MYPHGIKQKNYIRAFSLVYVIKQVVHMYELPFTQRHSCATERLQRTLHSSGVSVGGTGWIIVLIWNWHGRLLVQTQDTSTKCSEFGRFILASANFPKNLFDRIVDARAQRHCLTHVNRGFGVQRRWGWVARFVAGCYTRDIQSRAGK